MSKKKKEDYSPYEDRAALCPHFEKCGGCVLQKISYEKQLQMKAEQVYGLIGEPAGFEGILPSPSEEGYRNKMEFTFGDECKDGPFALGLHMRGSFMNIVNITNCHLVHEDINCVRNRVQQFFAVLYQQGLVTFRNNKTGKGYLRHLLIRRAVKTGEILVALVTTSQDLSNRKTGSSNELSGNASLSLMENEGSYTEGLSEHEMLDQLTRELRALSLEGTITGILHIINDGISDTVRSDRTDILFGRDYIYDEVLGLRFKISVFSFFQTNTQGAELLYTKAREYAAGAHGVLFDLYSGTGTIAQLMSPVVDQVYGVEIVPEAVAAARENAELNGISNAVFLAEDVLKALDQLPKPDSIILDPPREGIHPKALGHILQYGIEHIVYVSCNPVTLARDLESFRLSGYQIQKACCVDMFPQTGHVECVALLSNRNAGKRNYITLDVDLDEYYRLKIE